MEFLGIGGSRTGRRSRTSASALEQAEDGPRDEGVLGNQSTRLVQNILDLGIDGKGFFHSASRVADARARPQHRDPEAAVDAIVRSHIRLGAASGFVTSVGGFITLPVALPANVLGFYLHRHPDDGRRRQGARLRPAPGGDPHGGAADPRRAPTPTTCSRRPGWRRRAAR